MKKIKVYIDVFHFENGEPFYFIGEYPYDKKGHNICANICDTGYFADEDDLEDFLEEYQGSIEIVEDYRKS